MISSVNTHRDDRSGIFLDIYVGDNLPRVAKSTLIYFPLWCAKYVGTKWLDKKSPWGWFVSLKSPAKSDPKGLNRVKHLGNINNLHNPFRHTLFSHPSSVKGISSASQLPRHPGSLPVVDQSEINYFDSQKGLKINLKKQSSIVRYFKTSNWSIAFTYLLFLFMLPCSHMRSKQ